MRSILVDDLEKCGGCELNYICGGGCRGLAFLHHKNLLGVPDPIECKWKKIFFRNYIQNFEMKYKIRFRELFEN